MAVGSLTLVWAVYGELDILSVWCDVALPLECLQRLLLLLDLLPPPLALVEVSKIVT